MLQLGRIRDSFYNKRRLQSSNNDNRSGALYMCNMSNFLCIMKFNLRWMRLGLHNYKAFTNIIYEAMTHKIRLVLTCNYEY